MDGIKDQVDRNDVQDIVNVVDVHLMVCKQTRNRVLVQFDHCHDQSH